MLHCGLNTFHSFVHQDCLSRQRKMRPDCSMAIVYVEWEQWLEIWTAWYGAIRSGIEFTRV